MKKKIEICCYSVESAIIAEENGADRIELCDNYSEGGTTPSFASVDYCIKNLKIPINIIVRPRGGDFLYTQLEYELIKKDVSKIKELNANGIVIGFLTKDGEIDLEKTKEIVALANPMEVTFHRAFDMCKNPLKALEELKDLNITRILTSGAKNTAMEGIDLLTSLVKKAGTKISILPGSGVNQNNLKELIIKTGAKEFHSSAKTFENSKMNYFNTNIAMGGDSKIDEFKKVSTNPDQIKKMAEIIKQY